MKDEVLFAYLMAKRDQWFIPGNNRLWGEGNWIKCTRCLDSFGNSCFHHKNAHASFVGQLLSAL